MTISKRVLTKWRKEALVRAANLERLIDGRLSVSISDQTEIINRILVLTQELIDQHLLEEEHARSN